MERALHEPYGYAEEVIGIEFGDLAFVGRIPIGQSKTERLAGCDSIVEIFGYDSERAHTLAALRLPIRQFRHL